MSTDAGARDRFATGLILPLPELAAFTSRWRSTSYAADQPSLSIERRFPPHVTLLAPWAMPDDVTAMARLGAVAARFAPLRLTFGSAEMFAGSGVVWLRPEPGAEVGALMAALLEAFPEYPPYDGVHDEPIAHLTVSADGDETVLEQVRAALTEHGPVSGRADRISLYARDDDDVWRESAWVPLGATRPVGAR
jgi:2'-5' RNA ligase